MTFRIAFYKGTRPGVAGIYNRLVRKRGRGPYSHCELIFSDGLSASSSFSDGGVRFKQIEYDGDWDILDLPSEWELRARIWFNTAQGMPYDLMGNIFLAVGFLSHSKDKAFCSEAIGEALGISESWRLEPNTLFPIIQMMIQLNKARHERA